MARVKKQEIIRRSGTAPRLSDMPDLVVAADQDAARGYQGLSSVAVDVLGRVASTRNAQVAADRRQKAADDESQGSAQRTQEDLSGATGTDLTSVSESFRRGYLKTDGALRVRDWQIEAAKEVMQAEPGTDITPILNQRLAQLMESPEFQDPQVRASLTPLVQRASEMIRTTWQQAELKEIITRQEEGLTALSRLAIEDGSLLTPEGVAKMYANVNTEEYGYLDARDFTKIIASAYGDALAEGKQDPEAILQFLQNTKLPGLETTLLDSEHRDDIERAADAGRQVRAKAADEARKVRVAELEGNMRTAADTGRATNGYIKAQLAAIGITPETEPEEYVQHTRYWQNQQEQTLNKWKAEAEKRERERKEREALATGQMWALSDAKAEKLMDAEYLAAAPGKRGAVILKAARAGVVIPSLKNILARANTSNPEMLRHAADTFESLKQIDTKYAYSYLSERNAGILEQYHQDTTRGGFTPQAAMAALAPDRAKTRDASADVSSAWKEQSKLLAQTEDGQPRRRSEMDEIFRTAVRIQRETPGVSPETAIQAAAGMVNTRYTMVRGQRTLNLGMPRGAEPAVESLVESVEKKLGVTGLSALPNPKRPGQWHVVNGSGFPVEDPDTGRPIGFSPAGIAQARQKHTQDRASAAARRPVERRAVQQNRTKGGKAPLPTAVPLKGAGASTYKPSPGGFVDQLNAPGQTAITPEVPEDFLDYLRSQ